MEPLEPHGTAASLPPSASQVLKMAFMTSEEGGSTWKQKRKGLRTAVWLHLWRNYPSRGVCTHPVHSPWCPQGNSCLPPLLCPGEHLDARTKRDGFKLKGDQFRSGIRKKLFTMKMVRPWHRLLPRGAVAAPEFLEVSKVRLDGVCSILG